MIALDTLLLPRQSLLPEPLALPSEWPELDAALPDHGFPKGVVELTAPHGLGGGTSIALAVVRAAHKRDVRAWCAWIDTEGTLYAPGVAKAGVDLDRLLVVRAPPEDAGRIAAKVANARGCEVIVVDLPRRATKRGRALRPEVLVRKLALAAEESGSTILLLTDALASRDLPWPVALRLELGRAPEHLVVKVAKDRRGRVGQGKVIVPMKTQPILESAPPSLFEVG